MFKLKLTILLALPFCLGACNTDSKSGNGEPTHTRQLEELCDFFAGCENGLICEDGICRKVCVTKDNCPSNYTCENSRCRKVLYVLGNCGDGIEDPGEFCDDGNDRSGDGCSSKCNVENNYVCTGWPSKCQCASGFQDSNSDGICLSDCGQCGENQRCTYNADGSAVGCACLPGFQDSNHDGTCLPDCTSCDASQECRYKADGSTEGCFCPDGTQDNDGDGVCNPTCESKLAKDGACPAAMACYDEDGTADCECTYFVKTSVTAGSGRSWSDAENTIAGAVEKASQQIKDGTAAQCSIWIKEGTYNVDKPLALNNINIYGQFNGDEDSLAARKKLGLVKTSLKSSSYNITLAHMFEVSGKVRIADLNIEGYQTSGFENSANGGLINTVTPSELTVENCRFANIYYSSDSDQNYNSGLIMYLKDSRVNIENCFFENVEGHSSNSGGCIYSQNTNLTVTDSTFVHNKASYGGAIYSVKYDDAEFSSLTVKNSNFSNNMVLADRAGAALGGAIYNRGAELFIDNTIFTMNEAGNGGAIWNNGPAFLTNVQFYAQFIHPYSGRAGYNNSLGGCIYNDGDMTISNAIFAQSRIDYLYFDDDSIPWQPYLSTGVHVYNDINGKLEAGYIYADGNYSYGGYGVANIKDVTVGADNEVIYKYIEYIYTDNQSAPIEKVTYKKIGYKVNQANNAVYLQSYGFDSANDDTMKIYNSLLCGSYPNLAASHFIDSSTFAYGTNDLYCTFDWINLTNEYGYSYPNEAQHSYNSPDGTTIVKAYHDSAKPVYDLAAHQVLNVGGIMLSNVILPILKVNGENIWLPGDFGYSSYISRESTEERSYKYHNYLINNGMSLPVSIIDYYNGLLFVDSNTYENVDDETFISAKADVSKGPQVTTDIFGKVRKNIPDIGPFEF